MDEPLYVVDEFVSAAGCADLLRRSYLGGYAELARRRGMTLLLALRSPPVQLAGGSATLSFIWTIDGLPGWWRARLGAAGDPEVAAWWNGAAALIDRHRRSYHEDLANV